VWDPDSEEYQATCKVFIYCDAHSHSG
jgi:hypothetical protein